MHIFSIVCVLIMQSTVLSGSVFANQNQQQSTQSKLMELQTQIQTVVTDVQKSQELLDSVQLELRKKDTNIAELARQIHVADNQLQEYQKEINGLKLKQSQVTQTSEKNKTALRAEIQAAFAMGRQEYFKLVFNQDDPIKIGRMLKYYDYYAQARSQHINSLSNQLNLMDDLQNTIAQKTESLESLRQTKIQHKSELEVQTRRQQKTVSLAHRQLGQKKSQLKKMRQQEQELENLLRKLHGIIEQADLAEQTNAFETLKGRYPWPSSGSIVARFGEKRAFGHLKWQGVVLKSDEGQRVRAISQGRVVFANWLPGYGMVMVLDHNRGYMTLYGYNRVLYKQVGESVNAGEWIAEVGTSGGQMHAGLYFEVRKDGKAQNPSYWCSK